MSEGRTHSPVTEEHRQSILGFVRGMLNLLGVSSEVALSDAAEGPLTVSVQAPQDANLLIGKNGTSLRAMELIIRAAWARRTSGAGAILLDVNDYRGQRLKEMVAQVHDAARRVRDTRRPESLEPMTSYERRVVHTELAAYHDLETESIGVEPRRRVVIKPASV